jgi:hypothetical protein
LDGKKRSRQISRAARHLHTPFFPAQHTLFPERVNITCSPESA